MTQYITKYKVMSRRGAGFSWTMGYIEAGIIFNSVNQQNGWVEFSRAHWIPAQSCQVYDGLPPEPPVEDAGFVTAINAKLANITLQTYANILLRPKPNRWNKSQPLLLRSGEIDRIRYILGERAWGWALREDPKQIYCLYQPEMKIKQTSVSGFYSGNTGINKFKVLERSGKWVKVQTLQVGSDWYKQDIPAEMLHNIYTFKGYHPPCGPARVPLLTYDGWGWIESWQVK